MGVRSFNGSSDFLSRDAAPVTGYPFTLAIWFRPGANNVDNDLISLGNSANTTEHYRLRYLGASGNDSIDAVATAANSAARATAAPFTGNWSTSTWAHACGVFTSATLRAAFYNGGTKTTNATSRTPSGIDRVALGVLRGNATSSFFNGRMAHATIWSVALSDDEVLAIARGMHPRRMRGASIAAYWPLYALDAAEPDLAGGTHSLTATGTSAVDGGPPVEPYARRFWGGLFEEVTASGDATATGSLPTATASAPAGTATGDAVASGAGGTATASAPAGAATGDAVASGAGVTATASPAEGTASAQAVATGDLPTATATAPAGTATGDAVASGTLPTVTASPATGTASSVTTSRAATSANGRSVSARAVGRSAYRIAIGRSAA